MDEDREAVAQSLSLDLAKLALRSAEDMNRALAKLPDFKVRAEKPRAEDIRLTDGKPVQIQQTAQANFPDPLPPTMQDVDLKELGRVNINWRMLTTSRPRNRGEEDLFNRFVLLERLQVLTFQVEAEARTKAGPSVGGVARGARRQPVGPVLAERRHETCPFCTTEFCSGGCRRSQHEDHARSANPPTFEAFQASLRKPPKLARTVKKTNKATPVSEKPIDTKKTIKSTKGPDKSAKAENKANGAKMAAAESSSVEKKSQKTSKHEGKTVKKKKKIKAKTSKRPPSPAKDS